MGSGGWRSVGDPTDEEVIDHNNADKLLATLNRLGFDVRGEIYPHQIGNMHKELEVWRRLCKIHGMYEGK